MDGPFLGSSELYSLGFDRRKPSSSSSSSDDVSNESNTQMY